MPTRGVSFHVTNTEEAERSTERTRLLPAAVGGGGNDNTADEPEPRPHQTTSNGDDGREDRQPHVGNPWAGE